MSTQQNLFGNIATERVKNRNEEFPLSGLTYIHDFITQDEHDYLLKKVDQQPWLYDLKRRVQHYGFKYDYKARKVDYSMKIADLPDWLLDFADKLKRQGLFEETPDQVIVNEYEPGQGITDHVDCPPCFTDTIATLSLGSICVMNFTNKNNKDEVIPYLLETRSLVVLKEEARYNWMHGIKHVKSDKYFGHKLPRSRRVSLTFRKVIISEK